MTKNQTDEFSFVLKPAEHGVGVFAAHDIKEGTYLRLFGDYVSDDEHNDVMRNKEDVPEAFHIYCADRGDKLWCPVDFGAMPIGWYLNHSGVPSAFHKNYHWYAARDISKGEEITIDYNTIEEPEEAKEDFYK
jgi:SET domain-containing protein